MRAATCCLTVALGLGLLGCGPAPRAGEPEKPGHTTKEVMGLAHKSGLMKKAILGTATAAEKKTLTALYVDLAKNEPAKGSAESWKEKTTALVAAARDVEAGKPGAGPALRKAVDCDTCHRDHRPARVGAD
jgi:hypothetical protein